EDADPRLAAVVAHERDPTAVGRDVGAAGPQTEGQLLAPAPIGALPAVQIAPAIAEVVHARHVEHDLIFVGPDEARQRGVLDVDDPLDVEALALVADPHALADPPALGRDPLDAGLAVAVVVIKVNVAIVRRPDRVASVGPGRARARAEGQPSTLTKTAGADQPGLGVEAALEIGVEFLVDLIEVDA